MSLYRASPGDGCAWITGASSGIGRELAKKLAAEGWTVVVTARSEDKLESLASEAASLSGTIVPKPCDVTDEDAMAALIAQMKRDHGAVALAVFVAGNYWPVKGEAPELETYKKTIAVNYEGVLNGMIPLIQHMRLQGFGQLVAVGSASAYSGLPMASAYGATKSALNNMCAALKFDLDKLNIRIQIVNPGFVDTPLTDQNDFDMPFIVEVDEAANYMMKGIKSGGFEVAFPWQLALILKTASLLPYSAYFSVMRRALGWKDRKLADPVQPKLGEDKGHKSGEDGDITSNADPSSTPSGENRYSVGS